MVRERLDADIVVLATGGYDANRGLRNRFLPPGCEDALVELQDLAVGAEERLDQRRAVGRQVQLDGVAHRASGEEARGGGQ